MEWDDTCRIASVVNRECSEEAGSFRLVRKDKRPRDETRDGCRDDLMSLCIHTHQLPKNE